MKIMSYTIHTQEVQVPISRLLIIRAVKIILLPVRIEKKRFMKNRGLFMKNLTIIFLIEFSKNSYAIIFF